MKQIIYRVGEFAFVVPKISCITIYLSCLTIDNIDISLKDEVEARKEFDLLAQAINNYYKE